MSRPQTSLRNPPSTGYRRPAERRFYVWQDRHIAYGDEFAERYGWELHPWRWCCTLCQPPSYGFRVRKGAWKAIVTVSMPRHFSVRGAHHRWVGGHRPC